MKLLILSDLHFEYHKDDGKSFVDSLGYEVDVCILAGDIGTPSCIEESLKLFMRKFEYTIYVPGNHTYYGSSFDEVNEKLLELDSFNDNFELLDGGYVEYQGQRFLGSTLWFKEDPLAPKNSLNDFYMIENFEPRVYEENRKAINFLTQELRSNDVVITHHLPHRKSISPRFRNSPLNAFFLCDIGSLIENVGPKLWIHGHTHDSFDYTLECENGNNTRIICNPFGYAGYEENPNFKHNFVIEI